MVCKPQPLLVSLVLGITINYYLLFHLLGAYLGKTSFLVLRQNGVLLKWSEIGLK